MNGLKIQWGDASDKAYNITYPVAFTNKPAIFAKTYSDSSDNDIASNIYNRTNTGFSIKSGGNNYGNAYKYTWFAIGY